MTINVQTKLFVRPILYRILVALQMDYMSLLKERRTLYSTTTRVQHKGRVFLPPSYFAHRNEIKDEALGGEKRSG